MAAIRQWDTDWFDQFKKIVATTLTTLNIYPGTPLYWCEVRDIPFGQKQVQPQIRRPDQRVQVQKEPEYVDKYADRIVQVADLPVLTDSLRIGEEYYAGDPTNALGHVGDLGTNFLDALRQYYIIGTSGDPLTYGLIDGGAGTGSTTVTRPDKVDDVTTNGVWSTPANMHTDLAEMEYSLTKAGFHGPKAILTHPIAKPFLNFVLTSTATLYSTWVYNLAGYTTDFCEYYDATATDHNSVDVYMVDTGAFTIWQTPLTARAFWDDRTENYYWHWRTRGYLLSKPIHDGTDWQKGIVMCTVDLHT